MQTTRSRQCSQPCWELAALDDHTLRDIGLTRLNACVATWGRTAKPPTIRPGLGTGVLLSAVLAGVGLFVV